MTPPTPEPIEANPLPPEIIEGEHGDATDDPEPWWVRFRLKLRKQTS